MAEKKIKDDVKELRKLAESKKLVIGTDRTLKCLKQDKLSKIYLSSNCPEKVESEIRHFSGLQKLDVEKLNYSNEELGTVCKKPFPISVLSVLK